MATATSHAPEEINEIRRRMAQIRRDLHEDVRDAVKSVQSLSDWRNLVRSHPWLSLGIAATAGYLVVPKRRALAAPVPAQAPQIGRSEKGGWKTTKTAFALLAPIAVRAAQNYALQFLDTWLSTQGVHLGEQESGRSSAHPGAPPAATRSGQSRPGSPG